MASAAGLAVHDSGTGPALAFLHAFPLDASQWDHQVAALSGRFRCLRPDVWGCGASPAPPQGSTSLDDVAQAVLQELDWRGVGSFTAIGLSMGGYVVAALARIAPQRLSAVVLCNTRAGADSDAARQDRLTMAERVLQDGSVESLVEPNVQRLLGARARREVHITDPLRGRIRRCTPEGVAFSQRAMAARPDSTATLGALNVPTLVVSGRDDAVISAAETQALLASLPDARHVELDCGHLSNLELPADFSAAVAGFLGG